MCISAYYPTQLFPAIPAAQYVVIKSYWHSLEHSAILEKCFSEYIIISVLLLVKNVIVGSYYSFIL